MSVVYDQEDLQGFESIDKVTGQLFVQVLFY